MYKCTGTHVCVNAHIIITRTRGPCTKACIFTCGMYKHKYTQICKYIHAYVSTYIHTHTHIYLCGYVNIHTYTHTRIHTYIRTYLLTYSRTYRRTYLRGYMHTCIRAYLGMHIHEYTCTHIHTVHTYTHITYVHKYTYTCTCRSAHTFMHMSCHMYLKGMFTVCCPYRSIWIEGCLKALSCGCSGCGTVQPTEYSATFAHEPQVCSETLSVQLRPAVLARGFWHSCLATSHQASAE